MTASHRVDADGELDRARPYRPPILRTVSVFWAEHDSRKDL